MKALILAAGKGTRLRPHTRTVPKPLFTILGQPVLALAIRRLAAAGISEITVNSHYLGDRIAAWLATEAWPVPVSVRHEKLLLGTGGAIRNLSDFWDKKPFMVINSDIVCDIDLDAVIAFHHSHGGPATLVLRDCHRFNTVTVDEDGCIRSFSGGGAPLPQMTFTGIQVLDPLILEYIPPERYYSSIDAFRCMRADGHALRAYTASEGCWHDIGTPQGYRDAQMEAMAQRIPAAAHAPLVVTPLAGDGSDRRWSRLTRGSRSAVLVEHGICTGPGPSEADAMIRIGSHLAARGLPVPKIHAADAMAGMILFEDLGDVRFQDVVLSVGDDGDRQNLYQGVIDTLIHFSMRGAESFDPAWCWQTPAYDRHLIIRGECHYFVNAFLNGYHHLAVDAAPFAETFQHLAAGAMASGIVGLLHRDFQSRNLMATGDRITIIDFQGARPGPLQYDLAALVNDPYTDLPFALREKLVSYAADRLAADHGVDRARFLRGYRYLAIARVLQTLGAFGFLSTERKKTFFHPYIAPAVATFKKLLDDLPEGELDGLKALWELIPPPP